MRNTNVSRYRKLELLSVVCTLLSVVLLLSSHFGAYRLCYGGTGVAFAGASVAVMIGPEPLPRQGWSANWDVARTWIWVPHFRRAGSPLGSPKFTIIAFPLWIPSVIGAAATGYFHREARPKLPGHCPKCDYDLTGNVSGVCPECGTEIRRSAKS